MKVSTLSFFLIYAVLFLGSVKSQQDSSSSVFTLTWVNISPAGIESSSDNYSVSGLIGDVFAGNSSSENFQVTTSVFKSDLVITGLDDANSTIPEKFQLFQNYPNPFNPSTTIEFYLPYASTVRMEIVNILGEIVKVLADNEFHAGKYKFNWNAQSNASGVYIVRIRANSVQHKNTFVASRKIMLLK